MKSELVISYCVFVLILGSSVFEADAFSLPSGNNVTRIKRQSNVVSCDQNTFQCKTTPDCIDKNTVCDGKENCKDGSDEYESICKDVPCLSYLFKCDYGACIDGPDRCDGKIDCKDGSDEANCPKTEKLNTNCRSDEFECETGACIPLENKCDGIDQCPDKSDETREICFNKYCPGYTYRCAYGACVDGDARCNGVQNCFDNSDEENCDQPPEPTPKPPIPDKPVEIPTGDVCLTPEQPENGQWVFGHNRQKGVKGARVPVNSLIVFNCNKGYKLSTEKDVEVKQAEYVYCIENNKWTFTQMPRCEKLCEPYYYSTPSTTLKCKNLITGSEVKCDRATNNTQLTFSCAPYYEIPPLSKKVRYCYDDGKWDYGKPECIQVCGEKRVTAQILTVNGKDVERGFYPWVAAIYGPKQGAPDQFKNICGGSIITQKLILTAAHCITDNKGKKKDFKIFRVAVGKYYNQYMDSRDLDTAQYSELEDMVVSPDYQADYQNYIGDIAILVTKKTFALSKVVQPICYSNLNDVNIGYASKGVVTGWGYTTADGKPADVLKELELPYKDPSQCEAELDPEWFRKYFTRDKICAGYFNQNMSVCRGDSGGGLAFQNPADNRYYVRGIVSVGHSLDRFTCDIQQSSLFTDVADHYDWVDRQVAWLDKRATPR